MRVRDPYRIVPLADATETIPGLARLFVEEWEPYYGADGPGNALADLQQCCNHDDLPIAFVALDDSGMVIGTAALKEESVGSELGVGPWLAALVVPVAHRNRGVGTALVVAIENKARSLGIEAIFTSTDAAENIIRRRGWTALEHRAESLRGSVALYKLQLDMQSPKDTPPR